MVNTILYYCTGELVNRGRQGREGALPTHHCCHHPSHCADHHHQIISSLIISAYFPTDHHSHQFHNNQPTRSPHHSCMQVLLMFEILLPVLSLLGTLLPAVHFLEQAFAGADFSTEKFSAALSLISAALFQCPKIAKFSVAHFFKLSCDLCYSFSIAKSRKILRCSSSDI